MILTLLPLLDTAVYKFGDDVIQCNYVYYYITVYCMMFVQYLLYFSYIGLFCLYNCCFTVPCCGSMFQRFSQGQFNPSFSKKSRQSLIHAAYNNTWTFPAQTDQMRSVSENIIFGQLVPVAERRFLLGGAEWKMPNYMGNCC